jgi:hypothetical protein
MSAKKAAGYVVDVCTNPALAGTSGAYFYKAQLHEPKAWATDEPTAQRLWEISERMTGATQ